MCWRMLSVRLRVSSSSLQSYSPRSMLWMTATSWPLPTAIAEEDEAGEGGPKRPVVDFPSEDFPSEGSTSSEGDMLGRRTCWSEREVSGSGSGPGVRRTMESGGEFMVVSRSWSRINTSRRSVGQSLEEEESRKLELRSVGIELSGDPRPVKGALNASRGITETGWLWRRWPCLAGWRLGIGTGELTSRSEDRPRHCVRS